MAELDKNKKYPREGKEYKLKSSASRAAREDGLADGQFDLVSVPQKKGEPQWKYQLTKAHRSMVEQMAPPEEKKKEEPVEKKTQTLQEVAANIQPLTAPESMKTEPVPPAPVPEAKLEPPKPVKQLTPDEMVKRDLEEAAVARAAAEGRKPGLEVVDHTETPPPAPPAPQAIPIAPGLPPITNVASATSGQLYKCPAEATGCKMTFANKADIVKHMEEVHGQKPKKQILRRSQIESPTKAVWHIADEMTEANPNVTRKQVMDECVRQGIAFYTARTQYQQWLTAKRESDRNAAAVNGKK